MVNILPRSQVIAYVDKMPDMILITMAKRILKIFSLSLMLRP